MAHVVLSGAHVIDLGSELRQAREEKGISLAEAGATTRIKERYLKALEVNDWAALPTPVQTQGFLRNYAIYLGLDEDQVMARFGQIMRSVAIELPPSPTSESAVRTTSRDGAVFNPRDIDIERVAGAMPAWLSSDVFIGVVLALVVAAIGFGLLQFVLGGSDETPGVPTATAVLAPAATGVAPQATADINALPLTTPTFNASIGGVQLSLEATEHVWVRVTVDGVNVLEGILAPGAPQTWQGAQQIMLETANGAGLKAEVNGQTLDTLGERGQATTLVWGPSGPLTPAPTTAP